MDIKEKKGRSAFVSPIIIIIVLVLGASVYVVSENSKRLTDEHAISFSKLPEGAFFIPHPEDEKLAKETGGVAMKHYATQEDLKNGGPIYGVFGYTIVSIEYEIPLSEIGSRPIGDPEQKGKDFAVEELAQKLNIEYDHFHIGISDSHAHTDSSQHNHTEIDLSSEADESQVYLIHFMLISHETEVARGLICG